MIASRMVFATLLVAGILISAPAVSQDDIAPVRGIVRAVDEAWISTDLGFAITTLPFREGQSFKQGDILATFNCSDLEAELKSTEAQWRAEKITYDNNVRLSKLNAAGKFEVQLSQAKAEQAAAAVDAYRSKLSRCVIKAPFDGRIALMRAHAHEIPDRTQPLMQVVGEAELEIEMLLPSQWLRWLKAGIAFDLNIEETGRSLPAKVTRIAAVVDPVSQTVKVTGRFTGNREGVLPGMSGPAKFVAPDG